MWAPLTTQFNTEIRAILHIVGWSDCQLQGSPLANKLEHPLLILRRNLGAKSLYLTLSLHCLL